MTSPFVVSRVVELLPELAALRGVEQPPEHCWDVFDHTIETVRALDRFLSSLRSGATIGPRLSSLEVSVFAEHLGRPLEGLPRTVTLRLAALLHDVGKPTTQAMVDGRIRFPGHAELGAELSIGALRRLGFGGSVVDRVLLVVAQHMRPWQLVVDFPPTDHAIRRLAHVLGAELEDVLLLSLADHVGMRGPALASDDWDRHLRATDYVLERVQVWRQPVPLRLIDGHALMRELGLQPGPAVGKLLQAIASAQAAGRATTRGEALDLARELMRK